MFPLYIKVSKARKLLNMLDKRASVKIQFIATKHSCYSQASKIDTNVRYDRLNVPKSQVI